MGITIDTACAKTAKDNARTILEYVNIIKSADKELLQSLSDEYYNTDISAAEFRAKHEEHSYLAAAIIALS